MCLILFAVQPNHEYRLVIAANRDEFYRRPAEPADRWPDSPGVLAGRDKEMGGTWLGINENGRFAAVTNFREDPPAILPPRSRGELPAGFLSSDEAAISYSEALTVSANDYRGFNLLVADEQSVVYSCNRSGKPRILQPGCYGLSNQVLDCNWPKVTDGRGQLKELVERKQGRLSEHLFEILMGSGDTREFSNSFINGEEYGTRAATVVLIRQDGEIFFEERTFGANGIPLGTASFAISRNGGS